MEYKQIKSLAITSIIIGIGFVIILSSIPITRVHYIVSQIVLFYATILTSVVFIVYPMLYLISKNPKKISKEPTIQIKEVPKIIYCSVCGTEVDKEKIYCSVCGNKIKK